MRLIRQFSAKARKCHFCDRCFHYIYEKQLYFADVYATDKHIFDCKYHQSCPVDPFVEEQYILSLGNKVEASVPKTMAKAAGAR